LGETGEKLEPDALEGENNLLSFSFLETENSFWSSLESQTLIS
jgi:hypothetical protein